MTATEIANFGSGTVAPVRGALDDMGDYDGGGMFGAGQANEFMTGTSTYRENDGAEMEDIDEGHAGHDH